jgi:1-acyl-sn-glycerol-3-phosphate acyltransferase
MFYTVIKFLANIIFRILFRVKTHGIENVPSEGKFILCSNHANNLDPVFVSMVMPRKISWMAKKELFEYKFISYLGYKLGAFPVDRNGSDVSAIKNALRVLKDDKVLGIFPEGTRVKKMDLEAAKPGVALLSIKSGADILPVLIDSNYKLFSKINIYIGKPMDIKNEDGSKPTTEEYLEKSQLVLKTIYGLKNK